MGWRVSTGIFEMSPQNKIISKRTCMGEMHFIFFKNRGDTKSMPKALFKENDLLDSAQLILLFQRILHAIPKSMMLDIYFIFSKAHHSEKMTLMGIWLGHPLMRRVTVLPSFFMLPVCRRQCLCQTMSNKQIMSNKSLNMFLIRTTVIQEFSEFSSYLCDDSRSRL